MKKLPWFLILQAAFFSASAQTAGVSYIKRFGGSGDDELTNMTRLANGTYVVAGTTTSVNGDGAGNQGQADFYLKNIGEDGRTLWTKLLGGTGNEGFYGEFVTATADGGFYFLGSTSSSNGDIPLLRGSYDLFVAKMDKDGNVTWKKTYGGVHTEFASGIESTSDGGCIIAARSGSSNDGDVPENHSVNKTDVWVLKLDASGNIQWSKLYGGTDIDDATDIKKTADGGYVVAANVASQDGDLSGSVAPGAFRRADLWVFKISDTGSMTWSKRIGGSDDDDNGRLLVSSTGDIYVTGHSRSADGDFTSNFGLYDIVLIKISATGSLTWIKNYGAGAWDSGTDLLEAADGNIVFTGISYSAVSPMPNRGGSDMVMAKANRTTGNIAWITTIGGSANDFTRKLLNSSDGGYMLAGFTSSGDGEFPGSLGAKDAVLVKFDAFNVVKGKVFYDYNGNGIKEATEPVVDNIYVQTAKKDNYAVASYTYDGTYYNEVDSGTFVTKPRILKPQYYTITPDSFSSVFPGYYGNVVKDFAIKPIAGKKDLRIYLMALNPARAGFRSHYRLVCYNVGTDTIASGTIELVKSEFSYYSVSSPAATINGDTLRWQYNNFKPLDTLSFNISFDLSTGLEIGHWVRYKAIIEPRNTDLVPFDNAMILYHVVTGAYDPNDKQESHGNLYSNKDLENGDYLNYTVRFQNTGNDTAFTVVIKDTLSSKLDLNSFEMMASSHNVKTTLVNNIITWRFADILLVDSNRNEPASHGYVSYRIKPNANVQLGDTIRNDASIYFDYNPPIKTNTHITVVKIPISPDPEISNFKANLCSTDGVQKIKIQNKPGADYQAVVTAKIGNNALSLAADTTVSFDPSTLAAGQHTLSIAYTNSTGEVLLEKTFTVAASVTPSVDLVTNITEVVNLQDKVILTTSQQSGGSTPTYVFAKNREFTSILRAESSKDSIQLSPNSLSVGDNWIYVKLKTSEACYTAQTAVDSILVRRSSVTGITDPYNLLNIISASPNPFTGELTIRFTNPSPLPAYIELYDGLGRRILSRELKGQHSYTIVPKMSAGAGYLIFYNHKKQKIGTIPVIKR